jgi:predicted metalloprotease with PDZ domain
VTVTRADAPTEVSKPQPLAIVDTIPPARDVVYPGEIKLAVDATDTAYGIFRVTETIPVAAGPLTLLYPKWIPGEHGPAGQVDRLAGLVITGDGKPLAWRRDPIDAYAFRIDVPAGLASIDISFQCLSPTARDQGLIVMAPRLLNLKWHTVALYPAGYFVRNIMVAATAIYPQGWTSATALRPSGAATAAGGTISYEPVAFDTLVDSPVIAGVNARIVPLSPDVTLNIIADRPDQLAATPEQIAALRALVDQAVKLFGARHYDHYDILLALSDALSGQGLEHHRSSEQVVSGDFFTGPHTGLALYDLLAHEFAHSWNGKFRRPADLWTPDYRMPMQNSLLWVYEGQTVFWDNVLATRSGLVSKTDALDAVAVAAAAQSVQAGRRWRPLADTAVDPVISGRRPSPWATWGRGEDYYAEGQLVWLDADSVIREQSRGKHSMDDFARAFFGMRDGDWGVLTYTFDDVVAALNQVVPYDWSSFLHARVDAVAVQPPLDWLARGGYRLVYSGEPGRLWAAREAWRKVLDLSYSLGLVVGKEGVVARVSWQGPAFAAGVTAGAKLIAINGQSYSDENLKRAVREAKGRAEPLSLLVQQGDIYRTVDVHWDGGLRYPHLERTGEGPGGLDALYAPLTTDDTGQGAAAVRAATPPAL